MAASTSAMQNFENPLPMEGRPHTAQKLPIEAFLNYMTGIGPEGDRPVLELLLNEADVACGARPR